MKRRTRTLIVTGVVGLGLGGAGIAAAAVGDDDEGDDTDVPLTGDTLDRAVAAALAHTGGGEVTETEVGDDGAAFGVEVRLPDGSQVEVNLDPEFTVISSEVDED